MTNSGTTHPTRFLPKCGKVIIDTKPKANNFTEYENYTNSDISVEINTVDHSNFLGKDCCPSPKSS